VPADFRRHAKPAGIALLSTAPLLYHLRPQAAGDAPEMKRPSHKKAKDARKQPGDRFHFIPRPSPSLAIRILMVIAVILVVLLAIFALRKVVGNPHTHFTSVQSDY
jgi:hypothetical protein